MNTFRKARTAMLVIAMIGISAPACMVSQAEDKVNASNRSSEIVRQLVVTLKGDGSVLVTDLDGNRGQPCALCSLQYRRANPDDPDCSYLQRSLAAGFEQGKIPRIEVCLEKARVETFAPIAFMEATENPSCVYYRSIGTEFDFTEEEVETWLETQPGLDGLKIAYIMKHCFDS